MTALLPDPVPLDPPPGDPRALDDLTGRLHRAAALLGELADRLAADAVAVPSWTGRDATAATAAVRRVGGLAREAAEALRRAGERVALHRELLSDARGRLARLRAAQDEDFGAAAARLGGIPDPAAAGTDAAFDELWRQESARRRLAAAIREDVAEDAAAAAAVLAGCSGVAGAGGRWGDADAASRYLADLLPGWHEAHLAQRGREFAVALGSGDDHGREAAARELLPWAGDGVVAAAVLTGLGVEGFRAVLRRLGDGSLSAGSALARVVAAVLGAPVPPGDADEVARVRDGRHVDPGDHRTLDSDLVALGMGVVLAAGRGSPRAGPPAATVRDWGRQIVARERAMGAERIVDRVRLPPSPYRPGDPLQEVLARLAAADDAAPAAGLLRGQPTWSHLLDRPWDDGGAAFAASVARAGDAAGPAGAVAVRAGLRALATGLGDDGDPAGWSVELRTAAGIAPQLAEAVATRPAVVVGPLVRAALGAGLGDRVLLRGLGLLSSEPAAAVVLDRALAGAPPAAAAGYVAVREFGQRLAHALDEFAARDLAERRAHLTDVVQEAVSSAPAAGRVLRPLVGLGSVLGDLDGTWDATRDLGGRFTVEDAVRAAGGAPGAEQAHANVAALLGAPVAPVPPPTDWLGLVADLLPGAGRHRDLAERAGDGVKDLLDDEQIRELRTGD